MKICFVSWEFAPTTWGGTGVLISHLVRLLTARGDEVVLVLDVPPKFIDQFEAQDRFLFPRPELIKAYQVNQLCEDIPFSREQFGTASEWIAYKFHWAAKKAAEIESPDLVEFFDYCGVGYYAISEKISQSAYASTRLGIRLHNSIEAMDQFEPVKYDGERDVLYALEHQSLRLAEYTLYPSSAYFHDAYKKIYLENWCGEPVESPPPMAETRLITDTSPDANKILFVGRLFGFKGVDRFIDAAALLLADNPSQPDLQFTLAGYDSKNAPDGSATYAEYLRKRIPPDQQERFEFVGQISQEELQRLLPDVLFAVFPNLFESFGYAIHEMYDAGIPILLNDLPAYKPYFKDGENALIFDGSTRDLAQKMKMLLEDPALRRKLKKPYPVVNNSLGAFYNGLANASSPESGKTRRERDLLVVVIDDGGSPEMLHRTMESLAGHPAGVMVLQAEAGAAPGARVPFLGSTFTPITDTGSLLPPNEVKTKDLLLILKAGDRVDPEYIRSALEILSTQDEISFVGCWKFFGEEENQELDNAPWDARLEALPYDARSSLNRMMMRTPPGMLLADLFDPRMLQLGEIGYLWKIDEEMGPGVIIPKPLLHIPIADASKPHPATVSYLILQPYSHRRFSRIARHLLARLDTEQKRMEQEFEERLSPYKLAELDLQLLLKNLSRAPLGNLLRLNENFRKLFARYLGQ